MMVTLFKSDAAGKLRFYTVHDLQRSLLSAYALTVSMAVGEAQGKERLLHFEGEEEAEKWLEQTLRAKQRAGYRPLYRYASARAGGAIVGRCLVLLAG
jgi:predicted DNA-binding WGR domain protein